MMPSIIDNDLRYQLLRSALVPNIQGGLYLDRPTNRTQRTENVSCYWNIHIY